MSSQPPYPPQGGYPPSSNPPPNYYQPGYQPPPPYGYVPRLSSKVQQVTTLAILMIVQGALEAILGLLIFVMGPAMMASATPTMSRNDRETLGFMTAVFIILGVLVLITAGLKIVAGIKNMKYRGRALGIAALISSVASMLTVYCAPTAIGLLIYGLIIYLNDDVRRAFEMGEQGYPPEQIKVTPF